MTPLRVAVVDDLESVAPESAPWDSLEDCAVDFYGAVPLPELGGYDVIVAFRGRRPWPAEAFAALPRLRLLVSTGMGAGHIDAAAATRHGVTVCGTESRASATAELAWALILELARGAGAEDRRVRAGEWGTHVGVELAGRTLAIAGAGKIGLPVGVIGRAFGMDVTAWSPREAAGRDDSRLEAAGIRRVGREEFFGGADVLSVHLPSLPETRRCITAKDLRAMPRGSFVVNTSRADLLEQGALAAALAEGWIAGAAVDVFEREPVPADEPLLAAPNVVLSGHRGFVSDENVRTHYGQAVEDIRAYRDGGVLRPLV